MNADPYKIPLALKGKFYVWRRNDGFVSATNGYLPSGWTIQEGSRKGEVVSFEQLGYYDYWPDALKCIKQHTTKGEQNGNAAHRPQADQASTENCQASTASNGEPQQ